MTPAPRYLATIARDGWARADDFTYPRWALCHSADGVRPAARYKNGGPVHLVRTTAAKDAPAWMRAFVAEVRNLGGLELEELTRMADEWKRHRGRPPIKNVSRAA